MERPRFWSPACHWFPQWPCESLCPSLASVSLLELAQNLLSPGQIKRSKALLARNGECPKWRVFKGRACSWCGGKWLFSDWLCIFGTGSCRAKKSLTEGKLCQQLLEFLCWGLRTDGGDLLAFVRGHWWSFSGDRLVGLMADGKLQARGSSGGLSSCLGLHPLCSPESPSPSLGLNFLWLVSEPPLSPKILWF